MSSRHINSLKNKSRTLKLINNLCQEERKEITIVEITCVADGIFSSANVKFWLRAEKKIHILFSPHGFAARSPTFALGGALGMRIVTRLLWRRFGKYEIRKYEITN